MAIDDRGADAHEQHAQHRANGHGQNRVRQFGATAAVVHGGKVEQLARVAVVGHGFGEVEEVWCAKACVANGPYGQVKLVVRSDLRQLEERERGDEILDEYNSENWIKECFRREIKLL